MRKDLKYLLTILGVLLITLVACEGTNDNEKTEKSNETNLNEETLVFADAGWTSTILPTEIAKQILEEAGYNVNVTTLDQPVIFEAMKEKEIHFFMDLWLPYTEEARWEEHKDELIKVTKSYENGMIGYTVPSYVEEKSVKDLKGNADKYGGKIYTIAEGAGTVDTAREILNDPAYGLDDWELIPSSEAGMLTEVRKKISQEDPIVFTGWKPHSMFSQYDLKFLEEPEEHYKSDDIFVMSYKGIQDDHPAAYEILSKWSIEISELEDMMYENEVEEIPSAEVAAEWIEDNREKVDDMLGKYK